MEEIKRQLEDVLVAEVLILAKTMKAEKEAKGTRSTSDYSREAVALIREKRQVILGLLR